MSIIRMLISVVLFTGALAAISLSQMPPDELEGDYSPLDSSVELRWHTPEVVPAPDHYTVYRRLDGDPDFHLLATAPDRRYDDADVVFGATYLYRVTAVYSGGAESSPSNTVTVHVPAGGDSTGGGPGDSTSAVVQFESSPVLAVQLGEQYEYQAVVSTTPPGVDVCFEVHHGPDGMSVDGSGLVTWTPHTIGVFEVELRARACGSGEGEDAEQEFQLMVLSGAAASLHGTVTDSIGQPIDSVRIKIFDATTGVFLLKTRTNASGDYSFPVVNPGTYFLRADVEGELFEDVWYVNSHELSGATPVMIPENGSVVANFVLRSGDRDADENVTVSGTVRDTSGSPVPGVSVALLKLFHHGNDHDDLFDDDCRHGEEHHGDDDAERRATTDSSGNYQITADAGDYYVRAQARGYFEQFWDRQPSPLEAMILPLHRDSSGIDFALIPRPAGMEGPGSISGTVRRADDGSPLRAEVLGFMKNGSGHFTDFIGSDRTDSAGRYILDELPQGFYLVMVKGEDGIVPTFWSPAGGTPVMDSSSLIEVAGIPVEGIDFSMIVDSAEGLNNISGEVEIEIETPGKNTPRTPAGTAPLAGAVATIMTPGGQVAGYGITGPDGGYSAPGLAAGSYIVIFQKPGAGSGTANTAVNYVGGMPATAVVNASLQPDGGPGPVSLMGVRQGWNLVSVPVDVPDYTASAVFPTAGSAAYSFSRTYEAAGTLESGAGYWIRYASAQVLDIAGTTVSSGTVELSKGWNIIGSLSVPVSVASLSTTPPGLLVSDVFGYDGGYQSIATIQPGRGYWVRAAGAGTLHIQASAAPPPAASINGTPEEDVFTVTVTDGAGNRQVLSILGSGKAHGTPFSELPPVPPAGAFDARFAAGTSDEILPTASGVATYRIVIRSAGSPLRAGISGTVAGMTAVLRGADGETIATSGGNPSWGSIAGSGELSLTVVTAAIPGAYRLLQNYPNPFNPSTTIDYDLPVESRVSLKVYNTLGQVVGELVDEVRTAGAHSARWNAGSLASGVYFVRLKATATVEEGEGFTETIKMVLVR